MIGGCENCKRLNAILAECLREMPVGNYRTHTIENLPGRIKELAQEVVALSLDLERDDVV